MNEILMEILIAVAILGGLGLAFGLILAVASRVFYVKTDPRLEKLVDALPGANCSGCGYSGCAAYAQAVLEGKAPIGRCASGGDESAEKMAEIMGVKAEKVERRVALVRCSGTKAKARGVYEGIPDCLAAAKVAGNGPLICKFGCLGFGNCTKACKYDAIHIVDGVAKVDNRKCVGCMTCAAACPRNLIVPVKQGTDVVVACASTAKGAVTNRGCESGCIGCGLCQKICPNDAIHVENFLAVIDYGKCSSCGLCATVCPKHLIADAKMRNDADPIPAPSVN